MDNTSIAEMQDPNNYPELLKEFTDYTDQADISHGISISHTFNTVTLDLTNSAIENKQKIQVIAKFQEIFQKG